MKKLVLSLGLGLTLAVNAFADNVLEQLNSQVIKILSPFQNESTVTQLTFNEVETTPEHASKVALNSFYRKTGSQNTFELKLDNLAYNYGIGATPTTVIRGSIGVDFTKLLPQDEINYFIPMAVQMIETLAKEYTEEEYGDAASIKAVITSTSKDSEDNYTSLTALISVKIDLTKLPEETKKEDIMLTDIVLSLNINLKTGLIVDAFMISNPEYSGFNDDEQGLKELLDRLLARDERVMAEIESLAQRLDDIASMIVEKTNDFKFPGLYGTRSKPSLS
ncbi:hypothetical protein [Legionella quateirensis]|uniref:Uncharacterized protein n=1 Tax=Legionella quateirensis TaxID=45072 RepID=A0A378KPY5_9GAMM|nr:hypothetical protein [Legionella quateirensis]KTD52864.1 hypothetical protein Lqua_0697 [Legionella quateirensis]STY16406.1 Uncharacterised protein [Legionella quateirensis]